MKYYRVESSREVTQEQIDDVLADAFEHGVSYWCDEVRIIGKKPPGTKYMSDVLTRGGQVELHDMEDSQEGRWMTLTLTDLLEAMGKLQFDFDNYDAGDADAVVQQALFGEVIYG